MTKSEMYWLRRGVNDVHQTQTFILSNRAPRRFVDSFARFADAYRRGLRIGLTSRRERWAVQP